MKYLFPVTAINRDGSTRVLNRVADVVDFVRSLRRNEKVGEEWTGHDFYVFGVGYRPTYNDWILRDDAGRPVDHRPLMPTRPNWKNRKGNHEYRNGPVAHAGNYRGCYKFDAPRKRHGGRGVLARAEAGRREFNELMGRPCSRRTFYID